MDPQPDAILGLGTALPEHVVEQAAAAHAVGGWFPEDHPARTLAPRVFRLAGVAERRTVVDGFRPQHPGPLLVHPSPSTGDRMALYARHAPDLAERAARRALESARVPAVEIDHVVLVSCTGFVSPGPDIALMERLGMRRDVERTIVGFMGCHAAFNGLRVARAAARDGRTVLLVCVELCSLHVQPDGSRDALVSEALFGDGAAAAVVGRESRERPALVRLRRGASRVDPDGGEHMAWEIGDHGFRMRLSSYVPGLLGADLPSFVAPLAGGQDVDSWCVHPGGPAILAQVEDALGLERGGLVASRAALRAHGNLSSATVLYVLERELPRLAEGDRGVMLGFGPGLTLEGAAFTRGPAAVPAVPSPADAAAEA
jgi:predicted naringenin-chalcone synthase